MGLSFVYPEFLFALTLLSIPVIIHLFNFRRFKKIIFTNVRFLREVKEETTSRSRIKYLLVLLSRLLAVAFLVMAFAQPYLPASNQARISSDRALSVFIDNSFSMEAHGREGTLLDEAKAKAREIAGAFQPADQFQLLTGDFEPAHQRMVNRDEFLDMVDQLKISPAVKSISEITSRQREALNNSTGKDKTAFIISDFQSSATDFMACRADSLIPVTLLPVKASAQNNLYIDSCWFSSPIIRLNSPAELNIRIRNASPEMAENIPVKLTINGLQKAIASVSIGPEASSVTKMSFAVGHAGWQEAVVTLTDFPITFDDHYFFSFEITGSRQVVCINQQSESPYLKALFSAENNFILKNLPVSNIDYSLFSSARLVVLNELHEISTGLADELVKFVRRGGSLVIFPDSIPDMPSYLNLTLALKMDGYAALNRVPDKVSRIDIRNDLFSDVFEKIPENMDMPVVQKYFEMTSGSKSNREVILKLEGGSTLLNRYVLDKGKIYAFTVPMNPAFSGLSRHAIFAPLLFKIALLSQTTGVLSYVIGQQTNVLISSLEAGGEDVFHLINEEAKTDLIPAHRADPAGVNLDIPVEIRTAGNYKLTFKDKIIALLAFNYDRKESELHMLTSDQLELQAQANRLFNFHTLEPGKKDITKTLREMNEGIRLWKWCVIFTLVFLLVEIMLLKFLK